jgi:hypothetical protein
MTVGGSPYHDNTDTGSPYTDAVELHDIEETNTVPECHEPGKDTSLRTLF